MQDTLAFLYRLFAPLLVVVLIILGVDMGAELLKNSQQKQAALSVAHAQACPPGTTPAVPNQSPLNPKYPEEPNKYIPMPCAATTPGGPVSGMSDPATGCCHGTSYGSADQAAETGGSAAGGGAGEALSGIMQGLMGMLGQMMQPKPKQPEQQQPEQGSTGISAPTCTDLTASKTLLEPGESTTLTWTLGGGMPDAIIVSPGVGITSGFSTQVSPTVSTTYTVIARNSGGSSECPSVRVYVGPDNDGDEEDYHVAEEGGGDEYGIWSDGGAAGNGGDSYDDTAKQQAGNADTAGEDTSYYDFLNSLAVDAPDEEPEVAPGAPAEAYYYTEDTIDWDQFVDTDATWETVDLDADVDATSYNNLALDVRDDMYVDYGDPEMAGNTNGLTDAEIYGTWSRPQSPATGGLGLASGDFSSTNAPMVDLGSGDTNPSIFTRMLQWFKNIFCFWCVDTVALEPMTQVAASGVSNLSGAPEVAVSAGAGGTVFDFGAIPTTGNWTVNAKEANPAANQSSPQTTKAQSDKGTNYAFSVHPQTSQFTYKHSLACIQTYGKGKGKEATPAEVTILQANIQKVPGEVSNEAGQMKVTSLSHANTSTIFTAKECKEHWTPPDNKKFIVVKLDIGQPTTKEAKMTSIEVACNDTNLLITDASQVTPTSAIKKPDANHKLQLQKDGAPGEINGFQIYCGRGPEKKTPADISPTPKTEKDCAQLMTHRWDTKKNECVPKPNATPTTEKGDKVDDKKYNGSACDPKTNGLSNTATGYIWQDGKCVKKGSAPTPTTLESEKAKRKAHCDTLGGKFVQKGSNTFHCLVVKRGDTQGEQKVGSQCGPDPRTGRTGILQQRNGSLVCVIGGNQQQNNQNQAAQRAAQQRAAQQKAVQQKAAQAGQQQAAKAAQQAAQQAAQRRAQEEAQRRAQEEAQRRAQEQAAQQSWLMRMLAAMQNNDDDDEVTSKPSCNWFEVSDENIDDGEEITLTWDVDDASKIIITPKVEITKENGETVGKATPESDVVYTLTAYNDLGETTCSTEEVQVHNAECEDVTLDVDIDVDPDEVTRPTCDPELTEEACDEEWEGEEVTVEWSVTPSQCVDYCELRGPDGMYNDDVEPEDELEGLLRKTSEFSLRCYNVNDRDEDEDDRDYEEDEVTATVEEEA